MNIKNKIINLPKYQTFHTYYLKELHKRLNDMSEYELEKDIISDAESKLIKRIYECQE